MTFETITLQEVTITKRPHVKGSKVTQWNYDLDGNPFGAIWTCGEGNFRSCPLNTEARSFTTYAAADIYIRAAM